MSVQWTDNGTLKRGPSWSEMVDQAARLMGFENPDLLRARGTDLQILEYFKIKNHGHGSLRNWLNRLMYPPDDALINSPIHKELAAMKQCSLFYTTNYDDFIERSFQLAGRQHQTVAIEAHMRRDSSACDVVKFHGDFNFESTMVLTESSYEERLKLRTAMDYRFRADVLNRALLFIGYSFRDWNVSYLFRLVNDEFGNLPDSYHGTQAYIVVPDPSDFEMRLFAERNIEVIPVDTSNITSSIAALLQEIRI
jgi:hypothetical protein